MYFITNLHVIQNFLCTFTEYEVVVVTGNQKGGGTDANVHITIFGKSGQTQKMALKSNSKLAFERGHSDIFKLKSQCVGQMTKVRCVVLWVSCTR